MLESHEVQCPTCWEVNELLVDVSAGSQAYTEDCTVCCRPMGVTVTVAGDDVRVDVVAE